MKWALCPVDRDSTMDFPSDAAPGSGAPSSPGSSGWHRSGRIKMSAWRKVRAGQGDDPFGTVGAGQVRVGLDPGAAGVSFVRTQ